MLHWLQKAFQSLQSSTVDGCIRKAQHHLADLHSYIIAMERIEEDDNENYESNSEDSKNSVCST